MSVRPRYLLALWAGKLVQALAQRRGGGSALPGLVAEKLDPHFLRSALLGLPQGVVVISGTNGKTTTTKIVVELARSQGLRVLHNATGSNFTRGVASTVISVAAAGGQLNADIAILELDEAHALQFVKHIRPRFVLVLNVERDQLDRFGEIEHTAGLLRQLCLCATEGVVLNREDPLLRSFAAELETPVSFFGLSPQMVHEFPSKDRAAVEPERADPGACSADVVLSDYRPGEATVLVGEQSWKVPLALPGVYNAANAVAALCLMRMLAPAPLAPLVQTVSGVQAPRGRGETVLLGTRTVTLMLVKNPVGFHLALHALRPTSTMMVINDDYADGRDVSWLWDVDFSVLADSGVQVVAGTRAHDMALRLAYDECPLEHVCEDIPTALTTFLGTLSPGADARVFCTYTAINSVRRTLLALQEAAR